MDFQIRADRTGQGRRKLTREREAYFAFMDQGLSNGEACRRVGVHPRTGREWRNGRPELGGKQRRPRPPAQVVRCRTDGDRGRFLSQDERLRIADLVRAGAGVRAIARELHRAPSTISRELRRNRHRVNGYYGPHAAQDRADKRRRRPKTGKLKASS